MSDGVPIQTTPGDDPDPRILRGLKQEDLGVKTERDLLLEPESDEEGEVVGYAEAWDRTRDYTIFTKITEQ
eukprot:9611467-Prorocentrum_lima.AAC.1